MFNFVDSFLEYTKEAESPTSYFRWAAYTTIASVLRNNVYVDRVLHKIYPNVFTLILSTRSSLIRKSTPMRTALKLLQEVDNTKIIAGRVTIAGVINILATPKMTRAGDQLNDAVACIYAEELSSLLIEEHATDTLTDWYDGHANWGSHLSSTGTTNLENLCITMLTSTNEELVRKVFSSTAIQGGLLARTFLIRESERRHKNSLMYVEEAKTENSKMIQHLLHLSKVKGVMHLEPTARQFFHEWYHEYDVMEENRTTTGIEGRLDTHVLKLATIKSAAERLDRVITVKHIEESILEITRLLPNYSLFATGSSGRLEAIGREIIMRALESKDRAISKKRLMFALWAHGEETINETIDGLKAAGNIDTDVVNGEFTIILTQDFLRRYEQEIDKSE